SEMAGAAKELLEAVLVNPNSREEMCEALEFSLSMPLEEQNRRMHALREHVARFPVQNWGTEFLRKPEQSLADGRRLTTSLLRGESARNVIARHRRAKRRLYLFDYDGTLMPIMDDPNKVVP